MWVLIFVRGCYGLVNYICVSIVFACLGYGACVVSLDLVLIRCDVGLF